MENLNEKAIKALNELIVINNDRVDGYNTAAKETNEADLKTLFTTLAGQSSTYRAELSKKVLELGGTPADGTTNSGKFYRAWMDVKAALTGKDRKAIVSSCEFGEDVALSTYKTALENDAQLPGELRTLIGKQKDEIQKAHDTIRNLRDSMKKGANA